MPAQQWISRYTRQGPALRLPWPPAARPWWRQGSPHGLGVVKLREHGSRVERPAVRQGHLTFAKRIARVAPLRRHRRPAAAAKLVQRHQAAARGSVPQAHSAVT